MNTLDCDVLVVGGGAAGVAAAVAAGRSGARVVLLERYAFLGGMATAGAVGTVCGLYLRDTSRSKPELVASGFLREFAERLARASSSKPLRLKHGLWVLPFQPWAFAQVADGVVTDVRKITLVLHATVAGVAAGDGRIHAVRALAWNEPLTIRPKWVVDCSGEATVAALAGGPVQNGLAEQAPALVFTLENADPHFAQSGWLDVLRAVRRAVVRRRLPPGCDRLALVPRGEHDGRVAFKLNLATDRPAQSSWLQPTAWERNGRALVDALQRFLIENTASFRGARFGGAAAQVGVRTGRRIQGMATLTDEDVQTGRKSACGIARGGWPMERWGEEQKPSMRYFPGRECYEIALDCLRPAGLSNILVAGRCLSATPSALASARVIGTCLATGWAAGTVAAFAASEKTTTQAIARIRRQMTE